MSFLPVIVPRLKRAILSNNLIAKNETIHSFLNHPAGPFTIHFWAPTMKWGIIIANIADMQKPVDKVSLNTQIAVAISGLIWCRYSFVITPINYNLFVVNMFMSGTGVYQLYRKWNDWNIRKEYENKALPQHAT